MFACNERIGASDNDVHVKQTEKYPQIPPDLIPPGQDLGADGIPLFYSLFRQNSPELRTTAVGSHDDA